MPDPVVALTCTNCGAPLTIHPDMEMFACGHCGTQLIVDRRGGTVGLKRVEAAIRQVQAGTDRTAAELAVVRLSKELDQLMQAELAVMAEPVEPREVPRPVYEDSGGTTVMSVIIPFLSFIMMLFLGLLMMVVVGAAMRIDEQTGWSLHTSGLRQGMWIAAAIIESLLLYLIWKLIRRENRLTNQANAEYDTAYDLQQRQYKEQCQIALQEAQAKKDSRIAPVRKEVERVRQRLAENRRVLDS